MNWPFITAKWLCLSLVILFALKFTLLLIITSASFPLIWVWYIFKILFLFWLFCSSFYEVCFLEAVCIWVFIWQSCFLIEVFRPFTFNVLIVMVRIKYIFLLLFFIFLSFLFSFFISFLPSFGSNEYFYSSGLCTKFNFLFCYFRI